MKKNNQKVKGEKKDKKFIKNLISIITNLRQHPSHLIFIGIVILCIFLRFYGLNTYNPFGYDQVNNAWAAQHIIINHQFPLLGFQAKGNSGIYIGPFYYYLIAIAYFFTGLDPIASGIFAGLTSLFTLFTLYFILKRLFNVKVALIASFINTVAFFAITYDRVQGPINFIPAIALIIFYCLYKIVTGNSRYSIFLAIALGLSFHVHLTAIFFPIIIFFTLPFFPHDKKAFKNYGIGLILFLILMLPILMAFIVNIHYGLNISTYGHSYYLGLHLRRVMQLTGDALIQFDPFLKYSWLRFLKFVLVPAFIIIYSFLKPTKEKLLFSYLIILFFLIPWLVLSTYGGELSDYYFTTSRFIALFIISYFIYRIYIIRSIIPKIAVVLVLLIYAYFNISEFFHGDTSNSINTHREKALHAIQISQRIGFQEGVADSYFYYYYMLKEKGIKVY